MNPEAIPLPQKPSLRSRELAESALIAVRSGKYDHRPANVRFIEAYRQARLNERITDSSDANRLDNEASAALAFVLKEEDEKETLDALDEEILEAGATAADIRDRKLLGEDY